MFTGRLQVVEAGDTGAIPAGRVIVASNRHGNFETERSAFFSFDPASVRAVLQVGFGHPAEAIGRITLTP